MLSFSPLEQLPAIGEGVEHESWDIKLNLNPKKPFEAAKDVAALANHVGGHILVGASERNDRIDSYKGFDEARAASLVGFLDQAIANRCQPQPIYRAEPLCSPDDEERFVVAVTVAPFINGLVAVAKDAGATADGVGWVFPVRVGKQTTYLLPDKLPMYLLPEIRRKVLLLQQIPAGELVMVRSLTEYDARERPFRCVRPESNVVCFDKVPSGGSKMALSLDQVHTVYHDGVWNVVYEVLRRKAR